MRRNSLTLFSFSVLLALSGSARAVDAFSASPEALLALATAEPVPKDASVEVLLDETELTILDAGRQSMTTHTIFRIIDARSTPVWRKEISATWSPSRGERPLIEARVVSPQGVENRLDQKLILDASESTDEETYSDARVVRAPLPAIVDGAVVEATVRIDNSMWSQVGAQKRFKLQNWVPTRHLVVRVTAPASSALRFLVTDGTWVPKLHKNGVAQTLSLDVGSTPALKNDERGTPTGFPSQPSLWVSTVASWQRVAVEYSSAVDRQLSEADLRERARQVIGDTHDPKVAANRVLEWMKPLRYTSVDFGETAIVPRAPDETLRRGFGDCKDLATLVVGMLRAAGFQAWTALLLTEGLDNLDSIPGLSRFDHVIVRVGGPAPFWIDATTFASLPAGTLPFGDQGRMALIASPGTTGLTKIPFAVPEVNHESIDVCVELAAVGAGSVVETHTAEGSSRDYYRLHGPPGNTKQREEWEKWAKPFYDASGLSEFDVQTGPPTEPSQLRFRVANARKAWTWVTAASFVPDMGRALDNLPRVLTDNYDPAKTPKRKTPLVVQPQLFDVDFILVPPQGFQARPLARSFEVPLGPANLARSESLAADGSVHVHFRFRLDRARLSPAEVDAFCLALWELRSRPEEPVAFDAEVAVALEHGRVQEAVEKSRALIQADPANAMHHVRLARVYVDIGLGDLSRAEGQRAVSLSPTSADAWVELANARSHDGLGREFAPGWDRDGAVLALRKALELKYERETAEQLATVLQYGPDGERFGRGSQPVEALRLYDEYREHEQRHDFDTLEAVVALRSRQADQALLLIPKLEGEPERNRLLLAAVALKSGPKAAEEEATRLAAPPAAQGNALEAAATDLTAMREYALARHLLHAANLTAPVGRDDTLALLLARAEKTEERKDSPPEAAVRRAIANALLGVESQPVGPSGSRARGDLLLEVQKAYEPLFHQLRQSRDSSTVAMDLLQGVIRLWTVRLPNGGWLVRSTSVLRGQGPETWRLSPDPAPHVLEVEVTGFSPKLATARALPRLDVNNGGIGREAHALRVARVKSLRATAEDYALLARESLVAGDSSATALDNATAAVWSSKREDPDALSTLALAYVARGELVRAHAVLLEALSLRPGGRPGNLEWLVIGKLADSLGLGDHAQAAYTRRERAAYFVGAPKQ